MTTARETHTATLLTDGRVLIAGGSPGIGIAATASAELYDPATGTFTRTGDMTRPRAGHRATLLPDGRVLIVGGCGPASCYPVRAEVYDPLTGTFTESAGLILPPVTVTLLSNGQLLFSGFGADGGFAELYDVSTGTLTPAAGTIPERMGGKATLLANGKVLFTGSPGPDLSSPLVGYGTLYDPAAHTFSPTDDLRYYTSTLLMNGNVLFVGDPNDDYGTIRTAYLYDPLIGKFTTTGDTIVGGAATGGKATLLSDGTVLIVPSVEVYNPGGGTFSVTGSMITARFNPGATLLNSGQVLVTGGYSPGVGPLAPLPLQHPPYTASSAELYTPAVLVPAPVLFSLSGDGQGQGAILHAGTNQVASSSNPAAVGEALEIYLSGLADGSVIPPQVTIGGRMAEILFFGKGFGDVNQVNVRVPHGVAPGDSVPVRLTYLGRHSNPVTIGVR